MNNPAFWDEEWLAVATQQPSFTAYEIARRMVAAVNEEVITEYHAVPCDAVAKALGLGGAAVGFSVDGTAPELSLVRTDVLWPKQRVRFTARSVWILDTQWYTVACEDDDAARTADPDRVYVEPLGTAVDGTEAGVVLASFRAG